MPSEDISDKALLCLEAEEGLVLRPYKDIVGIPTQGLGHTSRAGAPLVTMNNAPWTREYAFQVARNDIGKTFAPRVRKALPGAKQHEHDGAVLFDYNTGGIHRASWVGLFKLGRRTEAETSFKSWNKAGGKVVRGLTLRRGREWEIIARGDYGMHGEPAHPGIVVHSPAVLKRGSRDAYGENTVLEFQRDLIALGYLPKGSDDGDYGPKTEAAVREFQRKHPHLTADGKAGPATRAQVQRALDLKRKAAGVVGVTGLANGAVGADAAAGAGAIDWTGLTPGVAVALITAIGVIVLGSIAWQYRGEIEQRLNKWSNQNVT